jgi:hypothetical protein
VAILLGTLLLLVLFSFYACRRLLLLRRLIDVRWGELEECLRRRHTFVGELMPLMRVAGQAGQLAADAMLLAGRVAAGRQGSPFDQARVESIVADSLRGIQQVAAVAPRLRAAPEYIAWRARLEAAEREIETNGQAYNHAAFEQNRMLKTFPIYLLASSLGFEPAQAMELSGILTAINQPAPQPVQPLRAVWKGQPQPPGPAPTLVPERTP